MYTNYYFIWKLIQFDARYSPVGFAIYPMRKLNLIQHRSQTRADSSNAVIRPSVIVIYTINYTTWKGYNGVQDFCYDMIFVALSWTFCDERNYDDARG